MAQPTNVLLFLCLFFVSLIQGYQTQVPPGKGPGGPGQGGPGGPGGQNGPDGDQMAMFMGNISDIRAKADATRPGFWILIIVMAGVLFVPLGLSTVGFLKHHHLKKQVAKANQMFADISGFTSLNSQYRDDGSESEDEGQDKTDHRVSLSSQPTSLSCAFVTYSVEVERPLKTRLWGILEKQNPFSKGVPKVLISDITAHFRPGTLTAIMGPSGSGKTTLLNLLSGRTQKGSCEGYFLYNGSQTNNFADIMRKDAGYVLQTDTFFADLTVEESLIYAALLRLPSKQPLDSKIQRVHEVIREVRLENVMKTKVGDHFTPGISGGQKRRLSIAIELLNLPSILLLDEPTSGLDANTAHRLIVLLKNLAHSQQRTIVTTIHSPRPESFAIFDDILLLGGNGKVVYFGPPKNIVDYFTKNGFKMDPSKYSSPGDFIIDIVGLDPSVSEERYRDREVVTKRPRKGSKTSVLAVNDPADDDSDEKNILLTEDSDATKPAHALSQEELSDMYIKSSERKALVESIGDVLSERSVSVSKKGLPFFEEMFILFSRRLARSRTSNTIGIFTQVIFVGALLAVAFEGQGFTDLNVFYRPYKTVMFIVVVCSYAMVLQYLTLVPQYFDERDILRREGENESCRISTYMLASVVFEAPVFMLQTFLLSVIGYWLVDLNTEFKYILFFIVLLSIGVMAWQALVCLCSFLTNNIGRVHSICFILLGLGTLFGGLLIVKRNLASYFLPFYYTSVPALTYRTLLHNDLLCCEMVLTCNDTVTMASKFSNAVPPPILEMNTKCQTQPDTVLNLGALALAFVDMQGESEMGNIIGLLVALFVGRFGAIAVWKLRCYLEFRLKDSTTVPLKKMVALKLKEMKK